ncbi:unnamed protein product [Rotaria magnacalcarata]
MPYTAALRATRICSQPEDLQDELEIIRITVLLNKYPPLFIDKHIGRFCYELTRERTPEKLLSKDYSQFRDLVLNTAWNKKEGRKFDFNTDMILHFKYTPSLAHFGSHFHQIWQAIFEGIPLDDIPLMYVNRLIS